MKNRLQLIDSKLALMIHSRFTHRRAYARRYSERRQSYRHVKYIFGQMPNGEIKYNMAIQLMRKGSVSFECGFTRIYGQPQGIRQVDQGVAGSHRSRSPSSLCVSQIISKPSE